MRQGAAKFAPLSARRPYLSTFSLMLSRIRGVDLVVARAEPESVASSRGGHAEVLPLPLRSSVVACSVRLRVEAARFLMLNRPPPLLGDGAALLRSPDRRRRSGDCAEELGAIRTCRARSAPGCSRGGHSSGRQSTAQARRTTRLKAPLMRQLGLTYLLTSGFFSRPLECPPTV